MVIIRRDYLRKLKHRSSKYQTQQQSREAELFSVGNEVIYDRVQDGSETTKLKVWNRKIVTKYEHHSFGFIPTKYIRHFVSDDITQDSTQAYAQMKVTNKWAKETLGAKLLMYLEDGATQHYKNACACGDKLAEAQELGIPIITFWSCTDDGKCEVDAAGKNFADDHVKKGVPKIVEEGKDPLNCGVLVDNYNEDSQIPPHQGKESPLDHREAFHLKPETIEAFRASRPTFDTLVILSIF